MALDKHAMVGFFVLQSGGDLPRKIERHLWGSNGLAEVMKELRYSEYGKDLQLILIEYYIEGTIPTPIPTDLVVGRFHPKDKSIGVVVPATRDMFDSGRYAGPRQFLADTTLAAVAAVAAKYSKKRYDTDFVALQRDVARIVERFRAAPE